MSALKVMSDMWAAYAAAWGGSTCEDSRPGARLQGFSQS